MRKYVFKPYSENFPELFVKEKQRIISHIRKSMVIEHIGSTAVPNLGGKGIIDIAIAVDKNEMNSVSEQLQKLGYEFRPMHGSLVSIFLRADLPDPQEGIRRYHIHLTYPQSKDWEDFIDFRDYLRTHPDEAPSYAELKKKAAEEVNEDGAKYRAIKEPIFRKIIDKSRKKL
jgi:GrpB-like predicted nucleotidyltransferase (UPF0157 family)